MARTIPDPTETFQAPQNGRRDPAQAGHPVNLIERHEVRQQQRHASVTTYRTAATEGRLWRGHSRPDGAHSRLLKTAGADPAQAGYPVNPIEWVTKSASSVTNSVTTGITQHRTAATEDVATL